jgi:hypothetical protein
MTDGVQFEVDEDGGFYISVGQRTTVYETYEAAVDEIQAKLAGHDDAFVAEMTVTGSGDDVEVNLEQVDWPTIIRDLDDRPP